MTPIASPLESQELYWQRVVQRAEHELKHAGDNPKLRGFAEARLAQHRARLAEVSAALEAERAEQAAKRAAVRQAHERESRARERWSFRSLLRQVTP